MNFFAVAIIFAIWLMIVTALYLGGRQVAIMRRSRERLSMLAGYSETEVLAYGEEESSWLRRWLYLAGYRSADAPTNFLLVAMVFFAVAVLTAWGMNVFGIMGQGIYFFNKLPGGMGQIFMPIVYVSPWLALIVISMIPWLVVRYERRMRILMIEQDLPVMLELLATLGESGLSFDASLERVLRSYRQSRPLPVEFRTFQADVLSGRSRVECLRRMSRRVDILSFATFTSAIVQAEQMGSSIADVLRRLADELRVRRRERAMEHAMSAPIKRVVPMVLCFLPGLFVFILGPLFYQIFSQLDMVLGNGGVY